MRPILITLLLAAPGAAQTSRQQAETSIRRTVSGALPPDVAARSGSGELNQFLSGLSPQDRASALRALTAKEGEYGDAAQGALGAAYLNLGDRTRALSSAERALRVDPNDPDALAVKARVLASQGRKAEAQGLLDRIPGEKRSSYGDAFYEVRMAADRPAGGAPAAVRPAAGVPSSASHGAGLARSIERAFARRGDSATLDAAIRKVDPGARSLSDLQRRGMQLGVDPGITNEVDVVEREGRKMLMFHPSVFDGQRESRVVAQVGRAFEEFAAERDGVNRFYRWIGGRITAVRIHFELDPDDTATTSSNQSDQRVLLDRGAASHTTPQGPMTAGYPGMEPMYMSRAVSSAQAAQDVSDVGVLLRYGAVQQGKSAPPGASATDGRYLDTLRRRN